MPRPSRSSRRLDALDEEIQRLRGKARELEGRIDKNLTYFQQHSGSMFVRSLLPRKIEGQDLTGFQVVDRVIGNERLQKALLRLADILAEKAGDGLNWLINKVFRK
jgi:hypothetical protein